MYTEMHDLASFDTMEETLYKNDLSFWTTTVPIKLNIQGIKNWGNKIIAKFIRNSDIVKDINISICLPKIIFHENIQGKWCDNLAHNLIKSIKIYVEDELDNQIDNQIILNYDSSSLDHISKYYVNNQSIYKSNIGNDKYFTNEIPEKNICLSLPLITNGNPHFLPICASIYSPILIEIELNNFENLLIINTENNAIRRFNKHDIISFGIRNLDTDILLLLEEYIKDIIYPRIINLDIYVTYLTISNIDRQGYMKKHIFLAINSTEIFYKDLNILNNLDNIDKNQVKFKLKSNNSVKTFYFGIKRKYIPSTYAEDSIKHVTLHYNDNIRLDFSGHYFSMIEPLKYGTTDHSPGYYMYTYSSNKNQISGSTNFRKFNDQCNIIFTFTLSEEIIKNRNDYQLVIITEHHNVITMKQGVTTVNTL